MQQHFVTFFCPGTFVPEAESKPIDAWDAVQAVEISKTIVARYSARPYAFQFTTRSRGDADLDSRETARSPLYYLGGTVLTLAQVQARNDPKDAILRDNMRFNGIKRIVENCTHWRGCYELHDEDIVLDVT